MPHKKDKKKVIAFTKELCSLETADKKVIHKTLRNLMRKYRVSPSKYQIRMTCKNSGIDIPDNLQEYLIKNKARSMSGIVSIGVSMPPLNSCSYNCSFCPTPLDSNNKLYVPKSYDEKEGAIARGLRNNWVGHYQVYERGNALLDLNYLEDSTAETDMNVVMDDKNNFIEIQGTSEKRPFTYQELESMLVLAKKGITELFKYQKEALGK